MKDIFRQYFPCFLLLMIVSLSGCGGGSDGPVIGGASSVAGMASVKLSFTVPAGVASIESGSILPGNASQLALVRSNESLLHIGGRSLADLLIPNAQAAPPPAGVSLIIVTISGPGMATIVDNISVSPGAVITRTYNVPVGPNRSIVVRAFNADGALIFMGTTLIPLLQASVPVTSNVLMVPTTAADVTPPVISLLGTNPVNVAQGVLYVDAGATALDNVDGNITANIVIVSTVNTAVIGIYTVTYNVSDAAGNAATQVTRTVNVVAGAIVDVTQPVIKLVGQNPVTVTQGTTYGDLGATASDNVDGDITTNLVIVNSVNTSVIGVYTVTYNVSDAAGNAAAPVTRTVNVVAAGGGVVPPPPPPPPPQNQALAVTVKDVMTSLSVPGLTVILGGQTATTDAVGAASFTVPPGTVNISTSHASYVARNYPFIMRSTTTALRIFVYPVSTGATDGDGDGLPDAVETNTGIYLGKLNTGSDPAVADTDGDGLSDGVEVLR